jgi:CRISPR/Cas system endoribonuclease Cas6 (RAMP superfamily)
VLDVFQPGVFHMYDYLFFYQNLKENVNQRIDAFMESHKLKQAS